MDFNSKTVFVSNLIIFIRSPYLRLFSLLGCFINKPKRGLRSNGTKTYAKDPRYHQQAYPSAAGCLPELSILMALLLSKLAATFLYVASNRFVMAIIASWRAKEGPCGRTTKSVNSELINFPTCCFKYLFNLIDHEFNGYPQKYGSR